MTAGNGEKALIRNAARPADHDAEHPAHAGQGHGLGQELPEDVAPARAQGLADADLARPLRDGDEHDVHHAHPPTSRPIEEIAIITR